MDKKKKYSFEKEKVIDAEVNEKTFEKKKLSFKDRFAKGSKILAGKVIENYNEYKKPENVLARKKFELTKTSLDAKIAKNKHDIKKYSENNQRDNNFGFGFNNPSSEKKKNNFKEKKKNNFKEKKKEFKGLFEDGLF